MLALLALLPILTALVLMVGFRIPATRAMPLAWLVAAVCAFSAGISISAISPPCRSTGPSPGWAC